MLRRVGRRTSCMWLVSLGVANKKANQKFIGVFVDIGRKVALSQRTEIYFIYIHFLNKIKFLKDEIGMFWLNVQLEIQQKPKK